MDAPEFVAPIEVPLPQIAPDLVVRPANVGQIARLLSVAAPVVSMLMALPPSLIDRLQAQDGEDGITVDDIAELFELLSKHPHKLIEMVAIATGLERAAVEALAPDRYAFLFAVVVQVNADFFSRATQAFAAAGRVLEQVKGKATGQPAKPGPAPSIS